MTRRHAASALIVGGLLGPAGGAAGPPVEAARLDLPVAEVVDPYLPYADFCRRHPAECDLSGPGVIDYTDGLMQMLSATSAGVNQEVRFALDAGQYSAEEYWALPNSGRGDCEDEALEKRRRLVARGLPRGAMRMALVLHKESLITHAVLTVETSAGTYILDSLTDMVRRWDQAPYNYEARERLDGRWERFDQTRWTFGR